MLSYNSLLTLQGCCVNFQKNEDALMKNIDDIFRLMDFDRDILKFAIGGIEGLQKNLWRFHDIENPRLLAQNTLKMLNNIKDHDSLRPQYQVIFNQCIVLLVSVFASSVADLFRDGICILAKKGDSKSLKKEELKISVSDLLEFDGEINERLGHLIADKNDLSFQDMKSIGRAFKDYFGFDISKDIHVNNIIMAQAGRHVIVHDSARINERVIGQVYGAKPRDLKPELDGDTIQFSPEEVKLAAESMLVYFRQVRNQVETRLVS
jgi:hypothetical protein